MIFKNDRFFIPKLAMLIVHYGPLSSNSLLKSQHIGEFLLLWYVYFGVGLNSHKVLINNMGLY